jgi:hypothetical protein
MDAGSGKRWHTQPLPEHCLPAALDRIVCTMDKPDNAYQEGTVFDMEAAGIFAAATQWLDASRVHSLKVISDTPRQPFSELNKKDVPGLIKHMIESIDALVLHLQEDHS